MKKLFIIQQYLNIQERNSEVLTAVFLSFIANLVKQFETGFQDFEVGNLSQLFKSSDEVVSAAEWTDKTGKLLRLVKAFTSKKIFDFLSPFY